MTVHDRAAAVRDAAALSELARDTFTETFGHLYSAANLRAFLAGHNAELWRDVLGNPKFTVRVGESDGALIAYCTVGPPSLPFDPGKRKALELRQLYVLKPWHGSGLGPRLMDWATTTARARGAEDLYLSVFTDNHRARAFYARHGFEGVGPYRFMVGDHADEDIIMQLRLR